MTTSYLDKKPFSLGLRAGCSTRGESARNIALVLCLVASAEFTPSTAMFTHAQGTPAAAAQGIAPQAPRRIQWNTQGVDSTNTQRVSPRDAAAITGKVAQRVSRAK